MNMRKTRLVKVKSSDSDRWLHVRKWRRLTVVQVVCSGKSRECRVAKVLEAGWHLTEELVQENFTH